MKGKKTSNQRLFKEINVWRQVDDKALIRYRCFQELPDGKFFVKSADHFHEPFESETSRQHEMYFIESLFENGLVWNAKKSYATLEKAIEKFDEDFDISFEESSE
jgi:hypothetical protein